MESSQPYEMVVGLEVHIQLNTNSKLFSGDSTAFAAEANSQTNEVSLSHPGTLPVLNKQAVSSAIKLGLACHSEIAREMYFDRKHYFYPDSPLGYQITQQNKPVCIGGYVSVPLDNQEKKISLEKIHMEADAGKSIHDQSEKYSLIDLNRAGMPLLELVTKPVLHSPEEAGAFISEIQKIIRFLAISDGNMEEGSLRCDANISLKRNSAKQLGQKVEIKNMNSIRNVRKALLYEYTRQSEILAGGGEIIAESRLYNVGSGKTEGMREKEEAHDYRYFPDPDLAPVENSIEMLNEIAGKMPMLPYDLRQLFTREYILSPNDASLISDHRQTANLLIDLVKFDVSAETAAKWIIGPIKAIFNQKEKLDTNLDVEQLSRLIGLVNENKVTYKNAVDNVLPELVNSLGADTNNLVAKMKLVVDDDETSLSLIIDEILQSHPEEVEAYKKGKKVLLQLFMGQVMKKTQGKADPKITMKLIKQALSIEK
jgi:aspartyl-tRNA(Asn)/glutamyl-tRNA(Gln) amidotransferase subunit B